MPKPKTKEPEDLKEAGRWMDAPLLMEKVEAIRQAAMDKVEATRRVPSPGWRLLELCMMPSLSP